MTRASMVPLLDKTWNRVEAFDQNGPSTFKNVMQMQVDGESDHDSDEWEYEDTEHLVTLDLGPESKRLLQMSHQYSITGLESETPFLRLGNVVFKGHWDQLIGTEILLRDQKDLSRGGGGGSSSMTQQQHDVQPLPPSQSDLRSGRPPSTTRTRIQFRPAVDIFARERNLREKATSKEMQSVKYKNWVWVRGRGWVRKEQVKSLELIAGTADENDEISALAAKEAAEPLEFAGNRGGRKVMTIEDKLGQSLLKSLGQIKDRKERRGKGEDAEEDEEEVEDDESNVEEDDAENDENDKDGSDTAMNEG